MKALTLKVRGNEKQKVITLKKDSIFNNIQLGDEFEVEAKGNKIILTKKEMN